MNVVNPLTVSIVIPAYNEEFAIRRCVMSCMDQSLKPFEIIVVNNKSTDNTVAIVKEIIKECPDGNIRLLHQSKAQGIIPTRDHGFHHAKGDIIGRIDADSIIEHGWVESVQRVFDDPIVAAASGPVAYHDMPLQEVGARADEQIRSALYKIAKMSNHRFLFGSNMAMRRSAWLEIKDEVCRDENDLMHEDIDLALHLHQHEMNVIYSPDMVGGMSARRLEDPPRDFYRYVMRFERTFRAHNIRSASARIPIFIYLSTYFPLKLVRGAYDNDSGRLSFRKLVTSSAHNAGEDPPEDVVS